MSLLSTAVRMVIPENVYSPLLLLASFQRRDMTRSCSGLAHSLPSAAPYFCSGYACNCSCCGCCGLYWRGGSCCTGSGVDGFVGDAAAIGAVVGVWRFRGLELSGTVPVPTANQSSSVAAAGDYLAAAAFHYPPSEFSPGVAASAP